MNFDLITKAGELACRLILEDIVSDTFIVEVYSYRAGSYRMRYRLAKHPGELTASWHVIKSFAI